ncbi:hypothetical protein ACTD5D_13675 [Nocardia takedensis]|uniref:hypothetical protein n=1 Tax=Nocardia takedensis TaxID=259390 RepID=UPI003F7744AB
MKIKAAVVAWRGRKVAQLKGLADDAWAAMQRAGKALTDLLDRLGGKPKPSVVARELTDQDRWVLTQGVSDSRGNSLTGVLRSGETPTPEQQRQIDAMNEALGKLPAYEGPLKRHTNLTAEQLDEFVPNQPYTDKGFMSASTNPAGANEFIVNNSNVEFQIVSKTGRDYSAYGTPDEILFPSGTNFFVQSKVPDPVTGRMVINGRSPGGSGAERSGRQDLLQPRRGRRTGIDSLAGGTRPRGGDVRRVRGTRSSRRPRSGRRYAGLRWSVLRRSGGHRVRGVDPRTGNEPMV